MPRDRRRHVSLLFTAILPCLLSAAQAAQEPCGAPPLLEALGSTSQLSATPILTASQLPIVGGPLAFQLDGGVAGAHGCLFYGLVEDATYLEPFGAFAYVADPAVLAVFELDGEGSAAELFPLAAAPAGLCGQTFVLQSLVLDDGAPGGIALTNGLRSRFGALPQAAPSIDPLPASTSAPDLLVSGAGATAGAPIAIDGGAAPVQTTVASDLSWSALVPLRPDQLNTLHVSELDPLGSPGPTASFQVVQDSSPPALSVELPAAGSTPTTPTVAVAGLVSDLLSGDQGIAVEVNGTPATVTTGLGTNATFELAGVALDPGAPTAIVVVARDVHGNESQEQLEVSFAPLGGLALGTLSGDGQSAPVGAELSEPLVVQALRPDGSPFAGKLVTFRVTRSDGRLASGPGGPGLVVLQAFTDAAGLARAWWTLGSDAGSANQRVEAGAAGLSGVAAFCASASPGPLAQLSLGSGDEQRGRVGSVLPEPLSVWASDGCNGLADLPVTFRVLSGGGGLSCAGAQPGLECTVLTDATGHARAELTLGSQAGGNLVEAVVPGTSVRAVRFQAVGLAPDGSGTRFRGVVLDNARQPLAGATCRLDVDGQSFTTTTELDGRFQLEGLPAWGPAHLEVDGSTVFAVGGSPLADESYPHLVFEPFVVEDADNALAREVLLPALDPQNEFVYDGTQDAVLQLAAVPGLEMTVFAGTTVTRPDGSVVGPADPVTLALNQVHLDDIPMPMPDGAQPPVAWTLQPPELRFDPPVHVRYPNLAGLPALATANVLTFDHATGAFEIVGLGGVTADGAFVESFAGSGLTLSGWGGLCPPYVQAGSAENCDRSCFESGEVTGAAGFADPDLACVGGQLRFVAVGGQDSGGEQLIACEDSTEVESTGPAEVQYRHVVVFPDGVTAEGVGGDVVVQTNMLGNYSCTFFAFVDRDCAPDEELVALLAGQAIELAYQQSSSTDYGFDDFLPGGPYISLVVGDPLVGCQLVGHPEPSAFQTKVQLVSSAPSTVALEGDGTVLNSPQEVLLDAELPGQATIEAQVGLSGSCAELVAKAYPSKTLRVLAFQVAEINDDVQLVPAGQGLAETACVTDGGDFLLQTLAVPDDHVAGLSVLTGPDGICATQAHPADAQLIPVGQGLPGQLCVAVGSNGVLETSPGGDDVVTPAGIETGPDGICQSDVPAVPTFPMPSAGEMEAALVAAFTQAAVAAVTVEDQGGGGADYDQNQDGVLQLGEDVTIAQVYADLDDEADVIVVFVESLESQPAEVPLGFNGVDPRWVFVDASQPFDPVQFAHLVGHGLGLGHVVGDDENLMKVGGGSVLRHIQWDLVHQSF